MPPLDDHFASDIRSMLAAQEMRLEKLPGYVLSGQIHPHDVQLLANENLLTSAAAQEVIEKCATDVLHAYEEAEKLAELVGKGRFTFEELEVMRAKGVLGSSIIQYLASRVMTAMEWNFGKQDFREQSMMLRVNNFCPSTRIRIISIQNKQMTKPKLFFQN